MRSTRVITAVDVHAGGEPGRVITGGVPDVPGATMYEKMTYLRGHADDLRRLMLREPRGYPALCCNVLLPPTHPEADAGFVIMEQTEYPPMSGSNTICVVTVLLETGILPATEPETHLTLETPAGLVRVRAEVEAGAVRSVTFRNVPAFAVHLDHEIRVPEVGPVRVDVAWGGMFYVLARAEDLGVRLVPEEGRRITRLCQMVKTAAAEQVPVVHPENPDIRGISIGQLTEAASSDREPVARNAVVVSTGPHDWDDPATWTGVLDRSPCGTGTCARMAVRHARGEQALGEPFHHEGILGTRWTGRLVEETRVGPHAAVVPTLTGRAWITGMAQYLLDPDDPFPTGFTVGDLWA